MNRYKYPKCKGNQYSASSDKSNEHCIYCKHEGTELMKDIKERNEEDEHKK